MPFTRSGFVAKAICSLAARCQRAKKKKRFHLQWVSVRSKRQPERKRTWRKSAEKAQICFDPSPLWMMGLFSGDQNRSWVSCWAKLRSYQKTLSGPGRPLATVVFLRRRGRLCGCELEQNSQRAANPPRENGVPGHNPPVSKAQRSCLAAAQRAGSKVCRLQELSAVRMDRINRVGHPTEWFTKEPERSLLTKSNSPTSKASPGVINLAALVE